MQELRTDILIVGAGLTGLMTAYALSDLNVNILVIDKVNFTSEKNNHDLRTTAIAEGSKEFFEQINIWSKIEKFSEPIKTIKVVDRTIEKSINFLNQKQDRNLGYIIRNHNIKTAILKLIKKYKNIKLLNNVNLKNIIYKDSSIQCDLDKTKIYSKLLIATDGKNSQVRNLLKTPVYKKNYNQKALVVNFHHTKNHNSIAYELFFNSGPLAILPMKKYKKNLYSSSVIWSHNKNYINNLCESEKKLISLILEEKINSFVGKIHDITDVQSFNLSAHLNNNFYENRVLYLGDSAHSIHPIAGQGWNVGIRDIKKCLEILKQNINLGLDIGSLNVCKQYHNQRFYDSYFLFQITDKLNDIFLNDSLFINKFRKQGFELINKKNIIKNFITNFAMGF